jgi:NADH-quinone oxidoreductase subunit L
MVTAGVYLLMRLFPFIGGSGTALAAIAVTGALTAFYGATCAMAQRDLKRILAYSTISQIGFMVMGAGVGAISAATFHLIVHAFFKALLFLGAGCVITAMRHEQDIFRMGGLRRSLPGTYWPFLAGALCLAGFPFTGGFFSKEGILTALWVQGGVLHRSLYAAGLLTALLTAFYTFRMLLLVFGGDGATPHKVPRLMERMLAPLAILGLGGVLLNLPPFIGSGILDSFLHPLIQHEGLHHPSHSEEIFLSILAALISLAGIAAAYLRYSPAKRWMRIQEADDASGLALFLLNGWYFDALYRLLFITPFVRLSRILWEKVDEGLIDDSLDRFAGLLGKSGKLLALWNSGRVSLYLLSLAAGLAVMIGWLVFSGAGY